MIRIRVRHRLDTSYNRGEDTRGRGRSAETGQVYGGPILDAALGLVTEGGPGAATIAGIAGLLGAPVGSIYHRFTPRDLLLARLWISTIKSFQEDFIEVLEGDDLDETAPPPADELVTETLRCVLIGGASSGT